MFVDGGDRPSGRTTCCQTAIIAQKFTSARLGMANVLNVMKKKRVTVNLLWPAIGAINSIRTPHEQLLYLLAHTYESVQACQSVTMPPTSNRKPAEPAAKGVMSTFRHS